jgi:3-dehydroquinate dehydratase-1
LIDQEPQFVDVEYDILSNNDELADYAESSKTKILVSWHDFERTPDHNELINRVSQMRVYSPYLKVVTMANSFDDALEIFELYQHLDTNINLVSFAMGESGTITRVLASVVGDAPFTYASLDAPIAPGQLSIYQMQRFYTVLKKRLV